ncbi:hypothetical protein ACFQU2_03730 [Siccirubricoccus deserti]
MACRPRADRRLRHLLRLPTLSISTFDNAGTWDEHAFILAARDVPLGQFPYLTFWDHKPPGSPDHPPLIQRTSR